MNFTNKKVIVLREKFSNLKNNKHLKNFASFGFGTVVAIILTFATTFILNTEMSRENMGEYSYVFNVLNLSFQIISLTMYSSYLRFIYEYNSTELVKFINKFLFFSVLLYVVSVYLFFDNYKLIPFIFIVLLNERLYYFRANSKIKEYNQINIAQKLLNFLLVLSFIYLLSVDLSGDNVIFCLGLSYLLVYLFSLRIKSPTNENVSFEVFDAKKILSYSFLGMASGLLNWVLTFSDQMIIEWYFGYDSLASYAVSFRIVSLIGLITGMFISYYPTLYFQEFKNGKFKSAIVFRDYFVFFLLLLVVVLYFLSDYVYMVFGASSYIDDKEYFNWLLVGEFFRVTASVFFTFKTYQMQQKVIMFSLLAVSFLNVALNIIFIPVYGPIAAAITTSVCFVLYFLMSIYFSIFPERKFIAEKNNRD